MTGKELRAIREQMGLTQAQLGWRLRTTGNTIARMEREEMAIKEPFALLVSYVAREAGVESSRISNTRRGRGAAKDIRAHGQAPPARSRSRGRGRPLSTRRH